MKIVIGAGSVLWNENHPALKKYGDACIVVHHGPAGGLLEKIGDDRDVLVLTDNDPASFAIYDMLASAFHSRRIHLFACLPFSYESGRKKREIAEKLRDLEMVKSLCLVELDSFLEACGSGESLGALQLRIGDALMLLLDRAIEAMQGMDEFGQFRFDHESGSYVPADMKQTAEDLDAYLNTKKRILPAHAETPAEKAPEEGPTIPETAKGFETEENPETTVNSGTAENYEVTETSGTGMEPVPGKPAEQPQKKPRRSLFSFLRRKKD